MVALVHEAHAAATAGLPTILLGETGTGKSALAERMHAWSGRTGALVEVNCANLSGNLAESELFGHERGAFTGADRAHEGRFREAHRGTLFLDEVAELPPEVQAKLLIAVERGQFRPVGARKDDRADVFVIAATHRDLGAMVSAGTFREDLYHRLCGCVLALPPLRDRPEGLEPLLASIFERHPRADGAPWSLGEGVLPFLQAHRWPGNVRELTQLGTRLVARASGPVIGLAEVKAALGPREAPPTPRRWIFDRLRSGPLGRAALFEGFPGSIGTLRRAIGALLQSGEIVSTGNGRSTRYALAEGAPRPPPAPMSLDDAARRWLARTGWTRSGLLAEAVGMGTTTAKGILAELAREGLIEVRGRGRGTKVRWVGPREEGGEWTVVEASSATRGGSPTGQAPGGEARREVVREEQEEGGLDVVDEGGAVGGRHAQRPSREAGGLRDLPERDRRALQLAAREGRLSRRALTGTGVPARSGSRVLQRLAGAGLIRHTGAGGWATAYEITSDGLALVGPSLEPPPLPSAVPCLLPSVDSPPPTAPRAVDSALAERATTAIGLALRQGRLLLLALSLALGPDVARLTAGLLMDAGLLMEIGAGEYVLSAVARPPPDDL